MISPLSPRGYRINRLVERVSALERGSGPSALSGRERGFKIEVWLEALERDRLSDELILFGVVEREDVHAVAADIASALRVPSAMYGIVFCFKISARDDRLLPLL